MRNLVYAAAVVAVTSAASLTPALADGPRASSGNNWIGMTEGTAAPVQPVPTVQPAYAQPNAAPPHYVLEQGYVHGGKWESHWVLVP